MKRSADNLDCVNLIICLLSILRYVFTTYSLGSTTTTLASYWITKEDISEESCSENEANLRPLGHNCTDLIPCHGTSLKHSNNKITPTRFDLTNASSFHKRFYLCSVTTWLLSSFRPTDRLSCIRTSNALNVLSVAIHR